MITTWNETITLKRKAAGTYVNGRWVPGSVTTSSIRATVEPMKPQELQILPEGLRSRLPIYIYTNEELKTASVADSKEPDILTYNDLDYEVHQVQNWTQMIPHFKVMCLRLTEGDRGS